MPSQLSLTYIDHGGEKSSFTGNVPTITAANIAATTTLINNLVAAIDDIILGNLNKRIASVITLGSASLPASEEAQREEKWLIHYRDTTAELAAGVTNPLFGQQFVTSVGTAELTGHLGVNSDFADLAETEIADFVTSFEALARSPAGGQSDVTAIEHVGRNT